MTSKNKCTNFEGIPVIGVASVKGGCGRSLVAGYLAIELMHRYPNTPIYLMDMDVGSSGQLVLFRLHGDGADGYRGTGNFKAQLAQAILDQDWANVIMDSIRAGTGSLRDLERTGYDLFRGLTENEGLLRLMTGPGIQAKLLTAFREKASRKVNNIVPPIKIAMQDVNPGAAITILDLDAGLDGETPEIFKECDEKVLVVRPDRQHQNILADPAVLDALVYESGTIGTDKERILPRFHLAFNFVPESMDRRKLLTPALRQIGYQNVLVKEPGRFNESILRDERFTWPIPRAFKPMIEGLADRLFDPAGD